MLCTIVLYWQVLYLYRFHGMLNNNNNNNNNNNEFIIISKISGSWPSGCNAVKYDLWVPQRNLLLCCQDSKVAGSSKILVSNTNSIFRVEKSCLPKRWEQQLPINCWCPSTKLLPIRSIRPKSWHSPQLELHVTHSRILGLEDQFCFPFLTD